MSYLFGPYRMKSVSDAVELPPSKSVAARWLTLRFLSGEDMKIENLPDCDDTRFLERAYKLANRSRLKNSIERIPIGAGAASLRFFLSAAASVAGVKCVIVPDEQLKKRPVVELIEALRSVGANIELADNGEIFVRGQLLTGGDLEMSSDVTSQFISAALMASPTWRDGVRISLQGDNAVSWSYVEMTSRLMQQAGVCVKVSAGGRQYEVKPERYYLPSQLYVEPDWSAASCFYEAALIGGGKVVFHNLSAPGESLQGDARCCELYARLGVKTDFLADGSAIISPNRAAYSGVFEADMSSTPDLVPPLVASLFAKGIPFRLSGISHLRYKECDRIAALTETLGSSLIYKDEENKEGGIYCSRREDRYQKAADNMHTVSMNEDRMMYVNTHGDHRMVMSIMPLCFRNFTLEFTDIKCVSKSFPDFFGQFKKLIEE